MTILGGDYPPVEVCTLDIVGYIGDGKFVILNPVRGRNRELPGTAEESIFSCLPTCLNTTLQNNQRINFGGDQATLHNINGRWHFKYLHPESQLKVLPPFTFFEIGGTI
jgi:hypothetical protein